MMVGQLIMISKIKTQKCIQNNISDNFSIGSGQSGPL